MLKIVFICVLQLVYVPILALRTISMVKKLKALTAILGIIETLIYVFGLSIVLSGDLNLLEMIVYAVGFGLGLVVGIEVENKIAIGYTSFKVNINNKNELLINDLRQCGYGVTLYEGQGRESSRYQLDILTRRSKEGELMALISQYEPKAFIMAFEPTRFQGGYIEAMMKKRVKGNLIQ